jgi:hypothetical protein
MRLEKSLSAAILNKSLSGIYKNEGGTGLFRPRLAGNMVNLKSANIFKGIFEMQKSTRNGKNNAKIRALGTWRHRVYHVRIYHDRELRGRNGSFTRAWCPFGVASSHRHKLGAQRLNLQHRNCGIPMQCLVLSAGYNDHLLLVEHVRLRCA